ncbi:MAG: 30S ribosomal protein S4 [Simkaniaceae bacterium]|nr:30S ribosomal protein S4 [Simkaniaceae bacterium]
MARYTGPKNRIARRMGVNIFGRLRNPLIHKPHPPGMHGARRKKKSDYGQQLEEKQRLRACYGMISQKQLVRYYKEAVRRDGTTTHELLKQLEGRLDVTLYRLRLASTIFHAHQLVAHGHVRVDGKKVDIRSFQGKPGMEIALSEKAQSNPIVRQAVANTARDVPAYLSLEDAKFKGSIVNFPEEDQIPFPLPVNVSLVCEFIAHTC